MSELITIDGADGTTRLVDKQSTKVVAAYRTESIRLDSRMSPPAVRDKGQIVEPKIDAGLAVVGFFIVICTVALLAGALFGLGHVLL